MPLSYYVQEIANNYLRNILGRCGPVHPAYLRGLEPETFADGFDALTALVKALFSDIAADPSAFGIPLKEIKEDNPKNADYTNSNAGFTRIPHMLYALGLCGSLSPDYSLVCEGESLSATAKALKITGLPFLLKKLGDYGFIAEGAGKAVKPGDRIVLSYPDSPGLTAVLKSLAEAQLAINRGRLNGSKNYFYMLHGGLLANEIPKAPKLTIDDLTRTLDDTQHSVVTAIHAFAAPEAKAAVRMGGFMRNDWSCVYTANKSKRVLLSFHTEQTRLSVKLNLQHIGLFVDKLKNFPAPVLDSLTNSGWECGGCHGSCAGGFAFTYDGRAYNKCRCGSFTFESVSPEILPYCIELLKLELAS